jgi:tripartite-type tricarboxylate transporter receptor subunit TctC
MTCEKFFSAACVLAASLALPDAAAQADRFPVKPLRIVTAEVGGGNDYNARVIAAGLTAALGQQVVVENRGGTPVNAVDSVMRAAPDGYILLLNGSNMWMLQYMRDNVPYDVLRDLAPVTLASSSPCILVVHPSLPVKSAKELIALARARPNELNYAAAPGGLIHIAAEMFKAMAGVKMVHVAYKGGGPSLNALFGGEVQLMFPTAGTVAAHLQSNRLRALAVTSAKPSKLFPQLPSIAATGLPGYESVGHFAVFVPLKTPDALVTRLNQEIVRALAREDSVTRLNASGIEPVGSTPAQLTAVIKSEMATLGKVIKNAGIRVE